MSKKIVLSEAAPPPLAQEDSDVNGGGNGKVPEISRNGSGLGGVAKKWSKRVLAVLSNLPLAIGEMFTIAALMALGTCCFPFTFFP